MFVKLFFVIKASNVSALHSFIIRYYNSFTTAVLPSCITFIINSHAHNILAFMLDSVGARYHHLKHIAAINTESAQSNKRWKRILPFNIQKLRFPKELFHPCHREDLTTALSPAATVPLAHSREGSRRHSHELDHPCAERDTYKSNPSLMEAAKIKNQVKHTTEYLHW